MHYLSPDVRLQDLRDTEAAYAGNVADCEKVGDREGASYWRDRLTEVQTDIEKETRS